MNAELLQKLRDGGASLRGARLTALEASTLHDLLSAQHLALGAAEEGVADVIASLAAFHDRLRETPLMDIEAATERGVEEWANRIEQVRKAIRYWTNDPRKSVGKRLGGFVTCENGT